MSDIVWQPVTVQLSALVPWDRNPKTISKAHAKRMLDLWHRLGQFQTIAIGPAGEVYDGHQRLSVLKAAHGPRFEVQALQSDRALTEKEREELTVAAHVGTTGQFSWDELSGWDTTDLQTWGFDLEQLAGWNLDATNLRELINATGESVSPDQVWRGMPEFEQNESFGAVHSIIVHFGSTGAIYEFAQLVKQTVNDKTKSIWYPRQEHANLLAYQVVDES